MKYTVITSIFEPTEAVKKYALINPGKVIVIGDMKSPTDWNCTGVEYFSFENQLSLPYKICKNLPINHYCRKMIGYLVAVNNGAIGIIDTDDDNIPKNNWGFPDLCGNFDIVSSDQKYINPYKLFCRENVWPRGLPLRFINNDIPIEIVRGNAKVGVWQGLADGDPDVDAIYRMLYNKPINFDQRKPIVLKKGTVCAFNSQNTYVIKELFPLLYLPSTVTFRFTDILRGIVAQPIMWSKGFELGFSEATVFQKRNPHDYMKDFESEVPMYLHVEEVFQIAFDTVKSNYSIDDNLIRVYENLEKNGIVKKEELNILNNWLCDLKNAFK